MSLQHIKPLVDHIQAESDVDALLRMTRSIGVGAKTLQCMLLEFVKSLDDAETRRALLKIAPMDDILGEDLLQSVASYCHRSSPSINKLWKRCHERNQKQYLSLIPGIINQQKQSFSPRIDHHESINRLFIVHPEQEELNEEARELEEQYLVLRSTSLEQCIKESVSGDKIYIQGTHVLSPDEVTINNQHLHIMGIGENANIVIPQMRYGFLSSKIEVNNSSIFMQNVEIEIDRGNSGFGWQGAIQISARSNVWMQDVVFRGDKCLTFHSPDSSQLHMLSCHFEGGSDFISTKADIMGETGEPTIHCIGCEFKMRTGTNRGAPIRGKCSSLHLVANRFTNCSIDWRAESKYFYGNVYKGCAFGGKEKRVESRNTLL